MDALFGTKNETLLGQILTEFDRTVNFAEPQLTIDSQEIIRRAVFERPPWLDLDVEREPHVMAAIVLAKYDQTHLATDSDFWKMPAIWDFIEKYHAKLLSGPCRSLSSIAFGRGLFGRQIESSWSFYGFLVHDEVQSLRAELASLQQCERAMRGPDFMGGLLDEMIGWLRTIEENKKDLWFYCA